MPVQSKTSIVIARLNKRLAALEEAVAARPPKPRSYPKPDLRRHKATGKRAKRTGPTVSARFRCSPKVLEAIHAESLARGMSASHWMERAIKLALGNAEMV